MISADQIAIYRDQGYLLVKGLWSKAEVAELRAEAVSVFVRVAQLGRNTDGRWQGSWNQEVPSGESGTVLTSVHNVQEHSATFTRLLVDPRLTNVLTALIGPNVQLHHTKMHLKPPEKGSPFPLHQDYSYFPHRDHSMLAAVLHFDDATEANGCLRVIPGSHRKGPQSHRHEGAHFLPPLEYPIESATPMEAEAGDLLLFNYLTIHGSGVNVSPNPRCILLIQVRSADDEPIPQTIGEEGQAIPADGRPGQGMMLAGVNPKAPSAFSKPAG